MESPIVKRLLGPMSGPLRLLVILVGFAHDGDRDRHMDANDIAELLKQGVALFCVDPGYMGKKGRPSSYVALDVPCITEYADAVVPDLLKDPRLRTTPVVVFSSAGDRGYGDHQSQADRLRMFLGLEGTPVTQSLGLVYCGCFPKKPVSAEDVKAIMTPEGQAWLRSQLTLPLVAKLFPGKVLYVVGCCGNSDDLLSPDLVRELRNGPAAAFVAELGELSVVTQRSVLQHARVLAHMEGIELALEMTGCEMVDTLRVEIERQMGVVFQKTLEEKFEQQF